MFSYRNIEVFKVIEDTSIILTVHLSPLIYLQQKHLSGNFLSVKAALLTKNTVKYFNILFAYMLNF